jgi:hypothetical protein
MPESHHVFLFAAMALVLYSILRRRVTPTTT